MLSFPSQLSSLENPSSQRHRHYQLHQWNPVESETELKEAKEELVRVSKDLNKCLKENIDFQKEIIRLNNALTTTHKDYAHKLKGVAHTNCPNMWSYLRVRNWEHPVKERSIPTGLESTLAPSHWTPTPTNYVDDFILYQFRKKTPEKTPPPQKPIVWKRDTPTVSSSKTLHPQPHLDYSETRK